VKPVYKTLYSRMCGLAQTKVCIRVRVSMSTQQNLAKEGSSDVVDHFSDIAGTLVSGFPGAFRWEPDTSPARRSSYRARG